MFPFLDLLVSTYIAIQDYYYLLFNVTIDDAISPTTGEYHTDLMNSLTQMPWWHLYNLRQVINATNAMLTDIIDAPTMSI